MTRPLATSSVVRFRGRTCLRVCALLAIAAAFPSQGCAPREPLTVRVDLVTRVATDDPNHSVAFPVLRVTNHRRHGVWVSDLRTNLYSEVQYSVLDKASGEYVAEKWPVRESGSLIGLVGEYGKTLLGSGATVGVFMELFLVPSPAHDTVLHLVEKEFLVWSKWQRDRIYEHQTVTVDYVFKNYVPMKRSP